MTNPGDAGFDSHSVLEASVPQALFDRDDEEDAADFDDEDDPAPSSSQPWFSHTDFGSVPWWIGGS